MWATERSRSPGTQHVVMGCPRHHKPLRRDSLAQRPPCGDGEWISAHDEVSCWNDMLRLSNTTAWGYRSRCSEGWETAGLQRRSRRINGIPGEVAACRWMWISGPVVHRVIRRVWG